MREGWEVRTFGDLYDIGSSKRVHKRDWSDHGVPFYRAREIVKLAQQGFVENDLFITEELFEQNKSKTGAPSTGDLMVTAIGTLGICYVVNDTDRFYFKDASVLWFRPKGEVTSRFMGYAFQAPQIREQTTDNAGATVGTLTISRTKTLKIDLPPLPEQKRIVAILDEAFEGIDRAVANTQKNLANARELFESYLNAVFTQKGEGWIDDPFERTIEPVRTPTKIKRRDFLAEGDYPIISQEADFVNGYWDDAADLVGVERPIIIFGDHTRVLKYVDFDFVVGADGVKILKPKAHLSPRFFYYALRSKPLEEKGYARHYKALKEQSIQYPQQFDQQESLANRLAEIEQASNTLAENYKRRIEKLAELKQSILQKAFAGELTAEPEKVLGAAVA